VLRVAGEDVRDRAELAQPAARRAVERRGREHPHAAVAQLDRGRAVAHRDAHPRERAAARSVARARVGGRAGTHAEMVQTPGATSRIVSSVRPAAPDPWLPCSLTGFIAIETSVILGCRGSLVWVDGGRRLYELVQTGSSCIRSSTPLGPQAVRPGSLPLRARCCRPQCAWQRSGQIDATHVMLVYKLFTHSITSHGTLV
jgi:hypothetical protein